MTSPSLAPSFDVVLDIAANSLVSLIRRVPARSGCGRGPLLHHAATDGGALARQTARLVAHTTAAEDLAYSAGFAPRTGSRRSLTTPTPSPMPPPPSRTFRPAGREDHRRYRLPRLIGRRRFRHAGVSAARLPSARVWHLEVKRPTTDGNATAWPLIRPPVDASGATKVLTARVARSVVPS
jgi:hypothetical protein